MAQEIRPGQALYMWRDVNLDLVRAGAPDLSSRQYAILMVIYLDLPPHTVRGLAERLKVTKPVITRALDTMGKLGLVTRERDPLDRRNVIIKRTVAGAQAVDDLAERIVLHLKELRA
ncbi:MAG: MarR family transcriptional regulator [Bosea sp.]|jgi:DNA-binding MarR family transcriptional regulator|nr:MarR family transcriptional regulator [Bosea sp. (in: a-proteobacteria)]